MIETQNWDKDWSIYKEDKNLSNKIIPIFESYLNSLLEKGASKTTFNRHKNACHALGGYIIGEVYGYGIETFYVNESGEVIILRFIDENCGTLFNHYIEALQSEIDDMCKKLHSVNFILPRYIIMIK